MESILRSAFRCMSEDIGDRIVGIPCRDVGMNACVLNLMGV